MTNRCRCIVAASAALLLYAGCQKRGSEIDTSNSSTPAGSAAAISSATAGPPAQALGVRVTLLDPGLEPRRRLRYSFTGGMSKSERLELTVQIRLSAGSRQLPASGTTPLKMLLRLTTEDVGSGNATFVYQVVSTEIGGNPSAPAPLHPTQSVDSAQDLRIRYRINSQGVAQRVDVDTRKLRSPQFAQMLDSLTQVVAQVLMPFPDEPIGVGGTWRVVSPHQQGGVTVTQQSTITVKQLTDHDVKVMSQIEQSALPGKVAAPGAPPGATLDLLELSGRANGTSRIQYSGFVAESAASYDLAMKLSVAGGPGAAAAESQAMAMNVSTNFTLRLQD